ncbi:Clavaminate synthase-like protein [Exidia glandulosa HHB12029]|uniref:Clavaminate synthase-like protein n=1 Tax=Exidia glandulosa HHB12029 TaxID=1314781 RepID=A0A165NCL0_EXIGL|nr:Clavaminate synthase-like protein [Exidia glandulosa HHB12029]
MATTATTLPIVDLDVFRARGENDAAALAECAKAADALVTFGALIVRDSRVHDADNETFLDLLEDYFAQPEPALKEDERPELGYQVGVTLENTEKPKCAVDESCLSIIARLDPAERPLDIAGHHPDPKCRFFYRPKQDAPPYATAFPGLNAENVVPRDPRFAAVWHDVLGRWGSSMKNAVEGVAEMAAVGLGLPRSTFTDAGKYGPHLLAPTASDLRKYGEKDTILAGFHTDLNFLTIHAASRYPGLHIWARNTGKRIPVAVPRGHLLVQAGKQLEHLSGGRVKAGFHEVVVNERTISTIERRKQEHPDRPLIRISSTFFWHLNSDYDLRPLETLSGKEADAETAYPAMKVGEQVQMELRHIALMA